MHDAILKMSKHLFPLEQTKNHMEHLKHDGVIHNILATLGIMHSSHIHLQHECPFFFLPMN